MKTLLYLSAGIVISVSIYGQKSKNKDSDISAFDKVDPDFPHNRFNHVIFFAPLKDDSVWLECTNSSLDFGSLDVGNENKNALLITENGGANFGQPSKEEFQFTKSSFTDNSDVIFLKHEAYTEFS